MRQLFLAFLVLIGQAWACSCVNTATPCSSVGGSSVIFVAEVITDSGEGWGSGPAKVAIVEPLQNVPQGLKETNIWTGSGTSCYRRLRVGERYVIITTGPQYSVAACNESFLLKGSEHILDAMRNHLKGGALRLVGTVRKSTGMYSDGPGIPNVTVELRRGESQQKATSDGEGRFVISGLEAGRYKIQVSKDGYVPDEEYNNRWSGRMAVNTATNRLEPVKDVPGEIEVLGHSCEIRDLAMWPAGSIRGIVRGLRGGPVEGVVVQAFGLNRKGEMESRPLRTAVTDSEGRYRIQPLPSGQYVVGVNARPYADESPYQPTVHSNGKPIYLGEVGSAEGIDLRVGAPRTEAKLRVRVVTADGKAHQRATVRLARPDGKEVWLSREGPDDKGDFVAPVYLGERYMVSASHSVFDKGIRSFEGTSSVNVNQQDTTITVVMQEEK